MKKYRKGEMTVTEMGRLGGLARAANCTPEQLSAIGRYGYEKGLAKYTPEELGEFQRNARRPARHLSAKKIAKIKELFKTGMAQSRIAETLTITRPTVARHLHRGKWREDAQKPSV